MKEFTVIQSNPNNKGGFVTKIQRVVSSSTVFGEKTSKLTYYVSGSKQLPVDSKVSLDIERDWRVATYPFANPETGEIMELKWLHLK